MAIQTGATQVSPLSVGGPTANPNLTVGGPTDNPSLTVGGATQVPNLTVGSTPTSVAASGNAINTAQTTADNTTTQINALLAQIAAQNQKVYAPALDTSAIYNTASTNAAANVNPYYTKLLNDFITQQGTARQQQQTQTATNIQNLQDQLTQLQTANTVTGNRATEDAATSEATAATAADNRQTDQGTAFDTARNAEAVNLAKSGLTGSGLAAGTQATSQKTQDTTEARQAAADQATKDATELTKARTFEDLATSNTNATSAEAKGETQANFDLNNFITSQTTDLSTEQQTLEQQRQAALATEKENQTKILVNNFINSISNPAQRQAAISAYGNL